MASLKLQTTTAMKISQEFSCNHLNEMNQHLKTANIIELSLQFFMNSVRDLEFFLIFMKFLKVLQSSRLWEGLSVSLIMIHFTMVHVKLYLNWQAF
jgi:hypothetical protein